MHGLAPALSVMCRRMAMLLRGWYLVLMILYTNGHGCEGTWSGR